MSDQIKSLMAIANRAKTIGQGEDYLLANAIFAFLLEKEFEGNENLSILWETQDKKGKNPRESHYDIVTIIFSGENSYKELSLPAPLLKTSAAVTALKRAFVVDRSKHRRSFEEGGAKEMRELMREAITIVGYEGLFTKGRSKLCEAKKWMLDL